MAFGKSQKQKRNLEAKQAKKKAEQQKYYNIIANMDDNRLYSLMLNGEHVLGGAIRSGKFWKKLHKVM